MSPYARLVSEWRDLRRRGVVRLREVACVGAARTLLLAEAGDPSSPLVALSAGVHGDEASASLALLGAVAGGLLPEGLCYRIWICTNPTGFDAGTRANAEGQDINRTFDRGGRSPEARAIITANRDRRFMLSIDLHEDLEAEGFYCYELPGAGGELGPSVLRALDDGGLPIQALDDAFDIGYAADPQLRMVERGRVLPNLALARKHFEGLTYSLHFGSKAAQAALTFEAPGRAPLPTRIATLRVATVTALHALLKGRDGRTRQP